MFALVVVHDFGSHKRGDQITDPVIIAKLRESENHANVVAVNLPDVPPAEPVATPS